MNQYTLLTELWLPRPRAAVFPFFAEARNLETLTPPWRRFEVLTPPPIPMRPGTLIDYRMRVHCVPIRWRTKIAEWQPPHRFVDEQLRGPYTLSHPLAPHAPSRNGSAAPSAATWSAIARAAGRW